MYFPSFPEAPTTQTFMLRFPFGRSSPNALSTQIGSQEGVAGPTLPNAALSGECFAPSVSRRRLAAPRLQLNLKQGGLGTGDENDLAGVSAAIEQLVSTSGVKQRGALSHGLRRPEVPGYPLQSPAALPAAMLRHDDAMVFHARPLLVLVLRMLPPIQSGRRALTYRSPWRSAIPQGPFLACPVEPARRCESSPTER